jgi:hypothetical protein
MNRPLFSLTAKTLFAGMIALCFARTSGATTYYWKGVSYESSSYDPNAGYGLWSSLSNWSTESESGADATALPGASDQIYGLINHKWRQFDLGGSEWTIGGWDTTGDWNRHHWRFTNGTLHWAGSYSTHSDTVHLDSGAVFIFDAGSFYQPSVGHGAADEWRIHSGATLSMLGSLQLYNFNSVVDAGGSMTFAPSEFKFNSGTGQRSYLQNSGTLSIPNGISFTQGASGGTFEILQDAGTLELGGPVSKNGKAGTYRATISGGTIHATGNVSFDFDAVTIPDNTTLAINVDEGFLFDLDGFTFGTFTDIAKTGLGDIPFRAGHIPESFHVNQGAIVLDSANTSYNLNNVFFSASGKVKLGAAGITLSAWDSSLSTSGGFVSGIATPVAGSTILTCANASVLAFAKTGIDATLPEGFATVISGNSLVLTSSYVFNSTTVASLNDPAGWAGGSVPTGKVVTIMGAGVAPATTDLPNFAGITIKDGASLSIANGGTISALTLADSASLTIASGSVTLGSTPTTSPSGANHPAIAIASGATLNVSGGTIFTDCSLSVTGTLATTTSGDLMLGHAAAGATASFGLSVTGGTISMNAGDIRFFCPASGGTVTPLETVSFTGATFAHDNDHGFFFGVNNPAATAITFNFDNTTLNYPKRGYYTISGGSALRFVNGGSLYRANNQNDKFTLTISGLSSIYLGPGTSSLIGESSNSGGSVGSGAMRLDPDTDGFISLTLDNATWETYHADGNKKGVVEVYGASLHTVNQNNWNRSPPFAGAREVHLNTGATLTISNNVDAAALSFSQKYTGPGSVFFSTPRSTTRTFNWNSTGSTATGTLAADATRPTKLLIATTATWAGNVIWNEKAEIDHSLTADAMTFGGIDLVSDFTWRIWGDGTCDHYTLTGDGFLNNGGKAVIVVADGSDADPGDSWTLARVPAGTALPTPTSSSWNIAAVTVQGDNSVVDIVLTPVSSDFVFDSTEITDITAAAGWSCGYVPTNENVKITGEGVVAIISDAATFPAFGSVAVKDGAVLKVMADVSLPPLSLDPTAKVVFGDNVTAVSAVLNSELVTGYNTNSTPIALPTIEVATNATLSVASGMKFKNVDFRLYGTVTKVGTDTAAPTFGYAENGETSYIAFTADGGVFDFHANNNERSYGAVSLVCPASGGTVIPVGTVTLRNAVRTVTGWADFGNWEFGVNNPTNVSFDVLVDGTHMDVSGNFEASGAAHLTLVNGSWIRRNSACLGHWFPMAMKKAATISLEAGCYIDFTANDGSFAIDSKSVVDTVTVRDGGIYNVTYNSTGEKTGVFVSTNGVLGVGKLHGNRTRTDLLRGFGSARLDGDLFIKSLNVGTGSSDWNRHAKIAANVPFSGTGDVIVTNGVPAYPFTVTIQNGASTATGAIRVNKAEGDAETALYFANGANWAGTVVAGDVSLTNLTDGATAATVDFGALDLAAGKTFPIRVWAHSGPVANDTVNVGTYVNNGGELVPVLVDGAAGEKIASGTKLFVGKIAKGSPLPKVPARWGAAREPIDGDDAYDMLTMKTFKGLQVILR